MFPDDSSAALREGDAAVGTGSGPPEGGDDGVAAARAPFGPDGGAAQHPAAELLSERAYRLIEERVVTLALPPGALLSEATLAADLGMGRTPVHAALQRLAHEGLVTFIRGRGAMVSPIDTRAYVRLLEARERLEGLGEGLAARRATPAQSARFAAMAEDFDAITDAPGAAGDVAFMRLDGDVSTLLLAAADNPYCTGPIAPG
jgi:DNA-binding GntR family transcriptional regulator